MRRSLQALDFMTEGWEERVVRVSMARSRSSVSRPRDWMFLGSAEEGSGGGVMVEVLSFFEGASIEALGCFRLDLDFAIVCCLRRDGV